MTKRRPQQPQRRKPRTTPQVTGPYAHLFYEAIKVASRCDLYLLVEGTPAWHVYDRLTGARLLIYLPATRTFSISATNKGYCGGWHEAIDRACQRRDR